MKTYQQILTEAVLISDETIGKIRALNNNPILRKTAKKIIFYKKNDEGLAEARLIASNMLNDIGLEMGRAIDKGKKFNIDAALSKKKYNKVTNPLLMWFREYATQLHTLLFKV